MHENILQQMIRLAIVCSIITFAGCDSGPKRAVVTGIVNYRGQSIPNGSISFFPSAGTEGSSVIVPIFNGRYTVESHGGLLDGTYEVAILGVHKPAGAAVSAGERTASGERPPPKDGQQYIPAKYNDRTELKATIDATNSPITLDFALTD